MPVIEIWGLPERLSDATLPHLTLDLCKAVADIEELDISESDVSVFYPLDQASLTRTYPHSAIRIDKTIEEEIIIFIRGLFEKPERTEEVRNWLAETVGKTVRTYFLKAKLIECFVETHDPQSGFWIHKE